MSLRKWVPAARSVSTVAPRSETSIENRFHPPGSGTVPSGMACPPPGPPPAALSTRRRGTLEGMATAGGGGGGVHLLMEAEVLAVRGDGGVHVVDDVADADGCHFRSPCVVWPKGSPGTRWRPW